MVIKKKDRSSIMILLQTWKNSDFMRFLTFDPIFTEAFAECGLRSFQIMAGAFRSKKKD